MPDYLANELGAGVNRPSQPANFGVLDGSIELSYFFTASKAFGA